MLAASLLDTMPQCRQTEEAFCLCIEQVFEDGGFVLRRDVPGIGVTYQDHCHGSTNKSKHLTWVAVISMSLPWSCFSAIARTFKKIKSGTINAFTLF